MLMDMKSQAIFKDPMNCEHSAVLKRQNTDKEKDVPSFLDPFFSWVTF